jgi:hypothetical protein
MRWKLAKLVKKSVKIDIDDFSGVCTNSYQSIPILLICTDFTHVKGTFVILQKQKVLAFTVLNLPTVWTWITISKNTFCSNFSKLFLTLTTVRYGKW